MSLILMALLASCQKPGSDPPKVCVDPPENEGSVVGTAPLQFIGKKPKNLLFLSIDTLRRDHVGLYGDSTITPTLDCLGEAGVVLDDFQQCSNWTFGSTSCTLAGRSNIERGHLPRLRGDDDQRPKVPNGHRFLAGFLADAGYYSVVVSGNEWLSEKWGNTQGYDEEIDPQGYALRVVDKGQTAIEDAIERGDADKWFLHLHFTEPHAAYDPPGRYIEALDDLAEWPEDLADRDMHYDARNEWVDLSESEQQLLEQHLRIRYAGEVSLLDDRLADVVDQLDRADLLEDTLVVVWSDHGEQFWEHGNQTHAYLLHSEETDAVGFFWAKNIVSARVKSPTHATDLVPTVLDVLGVDIPDVVTGVPVGTAAPDRFRFQAALARKGAIQTVERNGLRMQYRWYNAKVEVFDTLEDPGETTDLFDPTDPTQLQLWTELRPQVEAMAGLVLGGDPVPLWPADLP